MERVTRTSKAKLAAAKPRLAVSNPLEPASAARPGVAVGLSIWWPKLSPGGHNANAVTSQELTDMGGGATFYDCLVEVEAAPAPA